VNGREAARSGEWAQRFSNASRIKYSLDFLRSVIAAEAFEAFDWLADLFPSKHGRKQAGRLTSFC